MLIRKQFLANGGKAESPGDAHGCPHVNPARELKLLHGPSEELLTDFTKTGIRSHQVLQVRGRSRPALLFEFSGPILITFDLE